MSLLFWIILLLYAAFNCALAFTWLRLKTYQPGGKPARTRLTVVVVVRNEAENILALLRDFSAQTYPADLLEVIVVDDSSTDGTPELVQQYLPEARYTLRLLPLVSEHRVLSPKKRGITEAIRVATGELIITTDGDCRVPPHWLALLADAYQQRGAKLISAAVTFANERSLIEKMQTVEFSSLIGSGACALQWGFPTMCNGANLAYAKSAFEAVGGFAGVDHLASGDDELLMHKIAALYPKGIFFLKNPGSIVRTAAQRSLRDFYQQRRRWASKWKAYQDYKISLLAIFIFLSNFVLLLGGALCLAGLYPFRTFILQAALKFLSECVPLSLFLAYLQPASRVARRIALIPLVQCLYPFYVVFFGLAAQGKGFVWKGRKLS